MTVPSRGRFAPFVALATGAFLVLPSGCSTGLDTATPCSSVPVGSKSGNVTTGLFWGFPLTAPTGQRAEILEHAVAGAVVPGATPNGNRHLAFYAFTTDAAANNAGPGSAGERLDRDGLADGNGVADVFLAAVMEERVNQNAFSYSLAGKFRHPRCVNCHSVVKEPGFASAPLSTVFDASSHPTVEGVEAPQPGQGRFQNTAEDSCLTCHEVVLDSMAVEGAPLGRGWRNPALSLDADFRLSTTAELAQAARSATASHFGSDRRVSWALDEATLPSRSVINGAFTAADDDHDGIVEPFDSDGRRRAVPGGSVDFLAEVDAFRCSAGPDDTRYAITDVSLVSRGLTQAAADAGAGEPDVAFVPDPAYDPAVGGTVGLVHVAYSSTSTDIDALATSGLRQIYRATFRVVIGSQGVQLQYQGVELVSVTLAGDAAGDGDSSAPSMSRLASAAGATNAGARVAFVSSASNLGPVGAVGGVLVRDLSTNETIRASDVLDTCSDPSLDPTGQVVAFVTADVDLTPPVGVSDTNGLADVYFARLSATGALAPEADFPQRASRTNGAGTEADNAASANPDVILAGDDTILIAFESAAPLDALGFDAGGPATNVFVHSYTGIPSNSPVRVTRQASLARSIEGVLQLPDGSSRSPSFPGRSDRLVYETDATNLDSAYLMAPDPDFGVFTYKSGDENGGPDLVMGTLAGVLDGSTSSRVVGLSVSPAGAFGDGETVRPAVAGFTSGVANGKVLVAGLTFAQNLGAADNHVGLNPAERTPWLSFAVDSAPAATSRFERTSAILRSRCMPCHSPGGANEVPFSLGADDNALFTALTTGTRNCGGPTNYVVANDADNSLLIQVMEGGACGLPQMPDSLPPVPQNLIDVVRDWIDAGATAQD